MEDWCGKSQFNAQVIESRRNLAPRNRRFNNNRTVRPDARSAESRVRTRNYTFWRPSYTVSNIA